MIASSSCSGVILKSFSTLHFTTTGTPSDNSVMISATDGGVYRSEDCFKDTVEWNSLNNGYYTTQLYTATTSKNANSDVLHGGFQDNCNFVTFSGNPTDNWAMPFNGDGAYSGIADNEEDFFLTIQRGVAYKMKLDNQANRLSFIEHSKKK